MHRVWSFFIYKRQFSYLLLIALIGLGAYSLASIPKESTPEVQIPVGIVTTTLAGASAEDVETLITNEIEQGLAGTLENVSSITSASREGVSSVTVEFDANADIDESIRNLKDRIDAIEPDLPDEAEDPVVSEINFVDQPFMNVAITGDAPAASLTEVAEETEDAIESVSGVSQAQIGGKREREVHVIANKEELAALNLRITDVINAINASNSTLPVGSIELDGINYNVELAGRVTNPDEIRNIAVTTKNGKPIYVRDVAFVSDGLEDEQTFSRVSVAGEPSQPALSLSVFKQAGGSIVAIADDTREAVATLSESDLYTGLETLITFDTGELIRDDLLSLIITGLQTVALVMVILLLTIGWRESLVAGLAIPISFLISFTALYTSGNTINFVSLFALILAVGILVDSAIVVVESIHTKMKQWVDKREAALRTIREFHAPLTAGTLTTVAVFAPLFLVSGITGEFIAAIPFTIIFVLLASLLVALGFIPLIASLVLRRRITSTVEERQERFTTRLQSAYRKLLLTVLASRRIQHLFLGGIILLFLFSLTMPFTGLVSVIFFPQEDSDYIYAEVEMPQGTTLYETDREARKVEEVLYGEPFIDSFVTTIGQSSQFGNGAVDTKYANVFITLKDDRGAHSTEIVEHLRNQLNAIDTSDVRVSQPTGGPPVGDPIVIQFFGDDRNALHEAVLAGERLLNDIPGTTDVVPSVTDTQTQLVLEVDKAKATALGLDVRTIAQTLRAAVQGTTATTIKEAGADIDVVVRANLNADYTTAHDTTRATLDAIEHLSIPTSEGNILLGSVISAHLERASAVIRHEDQERVETLTSQLTENGNVAEVLSAFQARQSELDLPSSVRVSYGGESEETQESFRDMFLALIVGLVSMFALLVLQFNSYRHAAYVLSIVPFSLIGIFVGLAITGKPLSFPSIMGFIALAGIVVNNTIILIDVINTYRRSPETAELQTAVVEGSVARLRPVLLTALTTIIGIIPLTFASELWAPLAYAIMFGLAFAVVITLLLVPIIYYRWPGTLPEDVPENT